MAIGKIDEAFVDSRRRQRMQNKFTAEEILAALNQYYKESIFITISSIINGASFDMFILLKTSSLMRISYNS